VADTYLNHIDDKWVPAATGETFLDTNPARPDEVVGELPRSGPDDVDAVGSGHATVGRSLV
jgi:acyl-CoA reductase-like NAD-dependent aldehyde dehydrogenase